HYANAYTQKFVNNLSFCHGLTVGPTRLHKVEQSMDLVEKVINERHHAIMKLEKERKYKFDEEEENEDLLNFNDTDSLTTEQSFEESRDNTKKEQNANTV
uniref:Uncharacterized protein n=1 Tax=Clytia hemisphaerica TaxID=252671 RepID=A0A7M5UFM1_9CNID